MRHSLLFLFACFFMVSIVYADTPNRHGLVIGINSDQPSHSLGNAVNAAQKLHAALQENGVTAHRLLNEQATPSSIKARLQQLLTTSQPGDTLILTYTGPIQRLPKAILTAWLENSRQAQRPVILLLDTLPPVTAWLRDYPHVTTITTVPLPGANPLARPILSDLFTRAVNGHADVDRNAILSQTELFHFLQGNTPMLSDGRIKLRLQPRIIQADHLFRVPDSEGQITLRKPFYLACLGQTQDSWQQAAKNLCSGQTLTRADLIFDMSQQTLRNTYGDLIAAQLTTSSALQASVDKWTGLQRLKRYLPADPLLIQLLMAQQISPNTCQLQLQVDGIHHPYLVIFSLAGDGKVDLHYPSPNDPVQVKLHRPVTVTHQTRALTAPSHLLAISGHVPFTPLLTTLRRLQGSHKAEESLTALLLARKHQFAFLAISPPACRQ